VAGQKQMKRLALISLLAVTLTACADRTRVNCERIKNKAPETIGTQTQIGGGRCA
jgi:PBP1b-binding outer membrane lipoprotein LpoB